MKRHLKRLLATKHVARAWGSLVPGGAAVFTLHRFTAEPDATSSAMRLSLLDDILARLRDDGYSFVSLEDCVAAARGEATVAHRGVAFTIDDGYADVALAAELFMDYACPATVFVTTGFVDRLCWMWWDQIEHLCLHGADGRYQPIAEGPVVELSDSSPARRREVAARVAAQCTSLQDNHRRDFVSHLATALGIALPAHPPDMYRALTWPDIRRLEAGGIRFAPHTVTHPILSRTTHQQAIYEIEESWRRIRDELSHPVPIFAYPNGTPKDFGAREQQAVEAAGMIAAVTATPDYVAFHDGVTRDDSPFALPRFSEPLSVDDACLVAGGFNRLRRLGR